MQISDPEQLELFTASRWPHKPYCADDLEAGLKVRSLLSALKKPYIQANPPKLRVWSIYDVDRPGAAVAWEDANLPPPSWASANRENGHAHLVWGLSAPVLVEADDARRAPLRYLCAVEAAFRAALDADAGYSGLITKNPVHPLWRTLRGPRVSYELGELADWVELPKHVPKRAPEQVGLGRNVTLFDFMRHWAYRNVRRYKQEVRNFVIWQADCNTKALQRNGDFMNPLDGREVWQVAKSVAKWTWSRFDIEASDQRFSELQAHRSKLGHEARWGDNESKRASARLMAAQGMSMRAIGRELAVDHKTVSHWLNDSTPN